MKGQIRAVLFDLDGTLYHQGPVRALMAAELAGRLAWDRSHMRTVRALRAFRAVREEMRIAAPPERRLDELQFEEPAQRLGESPAFITKAVEEWMFRRPMKYLPLARRSAVIALASSLKAGGVQIGILSDYPVDSKIQALGVARLFSPLLCTTDPEINAFKPHPRGFVHACAHWGLAPENVAYVGDRADVDAAGAHAAGMTCFLVGRRAPRSAPAGHNDKEGMDGSRHFEDLERICLSTA